MSDEHIEVTAIGDAFRTYITTEAAERHNVNTSVSEPPVGALTREMLDNFIREVTMATGRRNLTPPIHFTSDFSGSGGDWPSFDTEQYIYQDQYWHKIPDPEPKPGIETLSMIGFK